MRLPWETIDTHVNASLMALNLAKVNLQERQTTAEPLSFSIASLKRLALNEHLLDLFIDLFELDNSLDSFSHEATRLAGQSPWQLPI